MIAGATMPAVPDELVYLDHDSHPTRIAVRHRRPQGAVVGTLYQHHYDWQCRDGPLRVRIWAVAPVDPIAAVADEPQAGALARLLQAHPWPGCLGVLEHPGRWLGADRMTFAHGWRALLLAEASDEDCWDRAWSRGSTIWGLADHIRLLLPTGSPERPADVLLALAYGHVIAEQDGVLAEVEESRQGWRWRLQGPGSCTVIGPDGFEIERIEGHAGSWQDRPGLGRVRLEWRVGNRRARSQPRVMPHG